MSVARIYRPRKDGGGGCEEGACLLAEKQWNNAKFSIREPCKVTPVCSLRAKRPGLFSLSSGEGSERVEGRKSNR